MLSSLFLSAVALSAGGGLNEDLVPPPVVAVRPPSNFILPGPYVPNFYPLVPSPVVMAFPERYFYPGPAWWYANNVSPYNPVHHEPVPQPKPKDNKKR